MVIKQLENIWNKNLNYEILNIGNILIKFKHIAMALGISLRWYANYGMDWASIN